MASVKERFQMQCNAKLFDKVYDPKYEGRICEAVNDCLNRGADINAVDRNNGGNTVLHEAVRKKSKSLVSFLLENGARTDIRNEEGFTAFELAKQLECDDDIIKLFYEYSQSLGFSSNEPMKFVSYSNAGLVSMLDTKPKQSVYSIDISGSDSHILLNEDFYKTIEMFENLIIFDVYINEEIEIDCSVVLGHLKSIKNPIIIQYRSPSTAKIYFKEFQRDPDFIDLNSQPMEIDQDLITRLEDEKSFGIRLIIECFLNNEFGKFRDDGCKILANINLSENGFKLLNLAVKHDHLLAVRFLLLYKVPPVLLNYSMKTLSREMLAALLKVEFPIPAGKLPLHTDVVDQFRQCKDELFKDAAYSGKQNLIEFLLQCVSDVDCKLLIGSFIEKKRYIIALAILKADALFPDNFNSSDINVSIPGGQEFADFLRKREHLHYLIINSTLDNIKAHFDKRSKLYLSTNNESAVATALRNRKFDIYGYLWSQGVCFKDDQEKQLISQLNYSDRLRLQEQMIRFISQIGESTINYLLSKTRLPSFQLDDARKEQIKRYYMRLNEIPEISIILAVVQYSDYLDIIFDFDNERTIEVDLLSSNSEGLYYPALGRIYIGAKGDENALLGVIAHELTHLAMQLVYSNESKPYFGADIVEEFRFNKLMSKMSHRTNVDRIISVVFDRDCYHTNVRAAELIVRVNHMLAVYGVENGEAMLENQVRKLLIYYRSQVMNHCQTFICESHLIKTKLDIQHINNLSGIIPFINNSNIRFKSQIDLEGFLKSAEKRILFFSTSNTWHITTQICQNFKDIKLNDDEFSFLNLKDLLNFKCRSTDSCHAFVLNVSPNFKVDQDLNVVADWVNRIFQNPRTKLILVLSARDESIIKTQLQCGVNDPAVEMRSDEHVELESFLASDKQTFIFKTQNPRLSTLGIYQLLVSRFNSCENSIVVVNFQDFLKVYRKYHQVLMSDACKMIVLESSKNYVDLPKAMIAQVNNAVVQCGKKLIVVMPGSVDSLLVSDDRIQLSKSVHSFSLNELTVNSSDLLFDRDVKFQGKLVKLRELIKGISSYNVIDAETIVKLTNEEVVITVGKEMQIDETFYVPRTLRYGARIKSKWVKKNLQKDNTLSKDTKLKDDLSEVSFIGQMDEHRLVIVSDKAGMGKTTLLAHIARLLKDKHPCKWIAQVNLNMCTDVLDDEAKTVSFNSGEMEKAVEFLIKKLLGSTVETNLERLLIGECIRSSGSIVILFDAFDELKKEQQKVIIKLIKCLQATKVKQMWMTTRPHMKELLESELLQLSLTLVSFTENDQLECITKIWMQKLSEKSRVEKFAKALLKRFNDCISDREFTGIPLQSFLLAQAFESECRAFHDSVDEEPHLPTRLNLIDLYKRFVDTKFDIFQFVKHRIKSSTPVADLNKEHLYPNYLRDHQLLALFTLFDEQQRDNLLNNEKKIVNADDIAQTLFPYGIINKFIGGQPQFVHRTFAEYFTAEFIIARLQTKEKNEVFTGYLVHDQIWSLNNLKTVRVFVDMLLLDVEPCSRDLGKQLDDRLTSEQLWKPLRIATEEANLNIFKVIFDSVKGFLSFNCPEAAAVFLKAIRLHRLEVMKLMLCAGYDVNGKDWDRTFNRTPLCEAVLCDNAELCEWLLQNGAKCHIPLDGDLNLISGGLWSKWRGCTALHVAFMLKRFKSVSVLLKCEADVNAADAYGLTPMHVAAMTGLKDSVALLVANKANINAVNRFGYTPLDEAIRWRQKEVVEYMVNLEGLDVNATNGCGLTPLHVAAVYGIRYIVQILINHGADMYAVVDLDKARTIKDDQWHLTEYLKMTTGHAAVTPLFLAKLCSNEVVVAVLKHHGSADVNIVPSFKQYKLIRKLFEAENNRGVGRNFPRALEMYYTENAKYRHII